MQVETYDFEGLTFEPVDWVPSCILSHLKKIYLMDFETSLLSLVRYLLQNSKVLERFVASIHGCSELKQMIENEILTFPKASPICKIEFVNSDYSDKLKLEYGFK